MSRRTAILIGAIALVVGLASVHVRQVWLQPLFVPLTDLSIGWLLAGCGLVASVARPNQTAGPRLVLAGFLWMIGAPRQWFADTARTADFASLDALSFTLVGWSDCVIAIAALSFPNRFPTVLRERLLVGVLIGAFAFQTGVRLLARSPVFIGVQIGDPDVIDPLLAIADLGRIVALAIAGLLLGRRWLAASRPARYLLGPVALAGATTCLAPIYASWYPLSQLGLLSPLPDGFAVPGFWMTNGLRALVPIAMLVGILRQRRSRSAVADALASVIDAPSPSALEQALARAFGDPSMSVLTWDKAAQSYVDAGGRPLSLPVESSGTIVTEVVDGQGPLAALINDRALAEDPGLIAAGVAVTRLVIENQQLSAELQRRLEEVNASRARIVEASDLERRRIERDLHDGVQQRLLALALWLRRAEASAGNEPSPASTSAQAALRHGADEALGVVEDVRELAQGIHPAILTEAGLVAALRGLAERSTMPIDVDLSMSGDCSPRAAAAAYFFASEALANVAKHARASAVHLSATESEGMLRVRVEDDGRGHADRTGSGLRGIDDRLSAMGGRLDVEERSGGGTIVSAWIPCA